MFVSTDARWPFPRSVIGSTVGAYPRGTGSNPVEENGHFFPHTISSIFRLSLTHTHTHSWSVFMHDCFAVELTGECLKCSFRLTRGGPYLRGVIGSTVGAYPRGTGSNPVEGNGHFFPSYRELYLSSFSDTLRPTQRRSLQMLDVAVPQILSFVFL